MKNLTKENSILDDVSAKFRMLRLEKDTRLLKPRQYRTVGGYPVAVEEWSWEGTRGNSIVFLTSDVGELTDKALLDLLTLEVAGVTDATISRRDNFVYVNHSFVA
jgi:hypothetical protein